MLLFFVSPRVAVISSTANVRWTFERACVTARNEVSYYYFIFYFLILYSLLVIHYHLFFVSLRDTRFLFHCQIAKLTH